MVSQVLQEGWSAPQVYSVENQSASSFPVQPKTVTGEGGFMAKQVFNMNETGLFWKRLSSHTDVSVKVKLTPGFKVLKDRLMFGGNASGDIKSNPPPSLPL